VENERTTVACVARRQIAIIGAVVVAWLLVIAPAIGGPQDADPRGQTPTYLIVADVGAAKLYVYRMPGWPLVQTFHDIRLGAHAGFLPLPDGRVLFANDQAPELVVLRVRHHTAWIEGRAPLPAPSIHLAASPDGRSAAVSLEGERVTVVDLSTFGTRTFGIQTGEPGVLVGRSTVYHRNDDPPRLEAFDLVTLVDGSHPAPEGTVAIGAYGHAEALDDTRDRIYAATDRGIEVVEVQDTTMALAETWPYAVADRPWGRAFYLRLAPHTPSLVSYISDRPLDEPWGAWRNDLWTVDTDTGARHRAPLAPGYVFRFALSSRYAVFAPLHPDGDQAILVDTAHGSPTFGQVVVRIPLAPLSAGPSPDGLPWEGQNGRATAITPDGRWAFVSHDGDGLISVIHTGLRRVVHTLRTPTDLAGTFTGGGSYMVTVQEGMPVTDFVGR
jgi:hypothetical protein